MTPLVLDTNIVLDVFVFDDEAAQTVADVIGSEPSENLMRAVKDGSHNCIPEPRCHNL